MKKICCARAYYFPVHSLHRQLPIVWGAGMPLKLQWDLCNFIVVAFNNKIKIFILILALWVKKVQALLPVYAVLPLTHTSFHTKFTMLSFAFAMVGHSMDAATFLVGPGSLISWCAMSHGRLAPSAWMRWTLGWMVEFSVVNLDPHLDQHPGPVPDGAPTVVGNTVVAG